MKRKLTTKRGYDPPADLHQSIEKVVTKDIPGVEDWQKASLQDQQIKFQILNELICVFDHDISNYQLDGMKTIQDVLHYFETPVLETTAYEDLKESQNLPENIHINLEPTRFNRDTDTLHGGVNALPGQDTIVTSIKYRRKYENIKLT